MNEKQKAAKFWSGVARATYQAQDDLVQRTMQMLNERLGTLPDLFVRDVVTSSGSGGRKRGTAKTAGRTSRKRKS